MIFIKVYFKRWMTEEKSVVLYEFGTTVGSEMTMVKAERLVSVIMPAYNCADYIGKSIDSVLGQTYRNWELVIVDDCSTDGTYRIAQTYADKDKRIKVHRLDENSGAAIARNKAADLSGGYYLAFLDSDDLWKPEKLDRQIRFMESNDYLFSCTAYGKVDEQGSILDKVVHCHAKYDYELVLHECFGNSTVVYNAEKLGRVHGADIRKRNDFALWLKVIKLAQNAYGLDEVLGYHRIRNDSISYKKSELVKWQWYVYRNIERLPYRKCGYLLFQKILQSAFTGR